MSRGMPLQRTVPLRRVGNAKLQQWRVKVIVNESNQMCFLTEDEGSWVVGDCLGFQKQQPVMVTDVGRVWQASNAPECKKKCRQNDSTHSEKSADLIEHWDISNHRREPKHSRFCKSVPAGQTTLPSQQRVLKLDSMLTMGLLAGKLEGTKTST